MNQNGQATEGTDGAITPRKLTREYRQHGHHRRNEKLRYRGIKAINGATWEGKQAKAWRAWALDKKGGKACSLDERQEIDLTTIDLWLMLCLFRAIVEDGHQRGTVLNRRHKRLPLIHDQYGTINMRFMKRREALGLDKARPPNPLGDLMSGGLG